MNTTAAPVPLLPGRRRSDARPIDSVDRSPAALAAMPRWRQVLTHPAVLWLAAAVLFTAGQLVLLIALLILGQDPSSESTGWTTFLANVVGYAMVVGILERRRPLELTRHPVAFLALGLLLGAVLMAANVGLIDLLGGVEWGPTNGVVQWGPIIFLLGVVPAIGEELMFRGIMFRYAEQGLGTWAAMIISAAFFGGVHLANPNSTTWAAVAIAIEAGILFAALYALTRSMWLVIGLHFAWNVVQGLVFGYHVSGVDTFDGWLNPIPTGNPLISGGSFGVEASIVAVTLCSLVSIASIILLVRRGGIIAPAWARPALSPAASTPALKG